MKSATRPSLSFDCGLDGSMRKQRPAASRVHAICGKVKRTRLRRPKVSMVKTAGKAKRKLLSEVSRRVNEEQRT